MTWIVGVDEAGYGPNLGPFVMSVASVRLPDERADAALWPLLADAVRRSGEKADGRVLVDDSKVVNAGPRGPAHLERGVLALLGGDGRLHDFLAARCVEGLADLGCEPWYRGGALLPALAGA